MSANGQPSIPRYRVPPDRRDPRWKSNVRFALTLLSGLIVAAVVWLVVGIGLLIWGPKGPVDEKCSFFCFDAPVWWEWILIWGLPALVLAVTIYLAVDNWRLREDRGR
jgi:hypothetical protein